MPDGLSVFSFAPAIKIIGRTISKIFNCLYAVFSKGDEHSLCYAWNIHKFVFNAKVLSLSIRKWPQCAPTSVEAGELGTKSV